MPDDDSRLDVLKVVFEQLSHSGTLDTGHWTEQQWKQSFDFLFVDGPDMGASDALCSDDLLFFVHAEPGKHAESLDSRLPYTVRRRGAPLPSSFSLSGHLFPLISWSQSLLLNLVMSCRYSLTVTTCPGDSLGLVAAHSSGEGQDPSIRSITRRVYANTTQTSVNIKDTKSKEQGQRLVFPPDVCFAVDSFNEDFAELVLKRKDASCFCVSLSVDCLVKSGEGEGGSMQAIVFSGFVSYEQVCHQMERQQKPFIWGSRGQRRERVLMAGPGGIGLAEVAVTIDQSEPQEASSGPIGSFLYSLTRILTDENGLSSEEASRSSPLQCSLMSMRLPVEPLARMIIESSVGVK
jgi:hypothetical protein